MTKGQTVQRLLFACLILGLAAAPSSADDFRLTVNDVSGLKQPWSRDCRFTKDNFAMHRGYASSATGRPFRPRST